MEEIYQTYLVAQDRNQLRVAMQELNAMNPAPMNTMLERQSREEAITKRAERKAKTVADVPPTAPGNFNKIQKKTTIVEGHTVSLFCVLFTCPFHNIS